MGGVCLKFGPSSQDAWGSVSTRGPPNPGPMSVYACVLSRV